MAIFLKILGAIGLYLVIGILVTGLFLSGRSLHMGAVGIVFVGPLIWPVLVVSMVTEKVEKAERKKANDAATLRHFDEVMAACPPGYEPAFNYYHSAFNKLLEPKRQYSREEAYAALFKQLADGNLPEEQALREKILEMGWFYTSSRLPELRQELSGLLAPEAHVLAGYAAGHILHVSLRHALESRSSHPGEEEAVIPALHDVIRVWERYLEEQPSPLGPLSMGSLYDALARRLPEGAERAAAKASALALYRRVVLECGSFHEMWCALYSFMRLGAEPQDLYTLLEEALATVKSGRYLDKYAPDYRLLPQAWINPPISTQPNSPQYLLPSELWPAFPDEETRLASSYWLIPLMYAYADYFNSDRQMRAFMYDRYAQTRNIGWADMFLRLIGEEAQAEEEGKRHGLREAMVFFQAENAFMHGDTEKAHALLRRYYTRYEHVRQHTLMGGDWGGSKQGRAFYELDQSVRWKIADEEVSGGGGRPIGGGN